MKVKTLNISLPEELVRHIDRQAKFSYQTRSAYIKQAIIEALKKAGALETDRISNPEETYAALRRKKLGDYLASIDVDKIAPDG